MNLAELARSIAAEPNLCNRVTDAASQEFDCPWVSLEQAIVLLGRQRLWKLLSSMRLGRSTTWMHRPVHVNHNPAASLSLLENHQEELI
jgi:hypothetical protein